MVTPYAKREAVSFCRQPMVSVSEGRVLRWPWIGRLFANQSKRPDDTKLRNQVKQIASERRCFGYRRIHVLFEREGIQVSLKKLWRIYSEEKPQVKRRGRRKRARAHGDRWKSQRR